MEALIILVFVVGGLCKALWPLSPILFFALAAIVLRIWRCEDRGWELAVLMGVAMLSGGVVTYQAIARGSPMVWWLMAGLGAVIATYLVARLAPRLRSVLVAVRPSALVATSAIAVVLAAQVTLSYRTDTDPAEVGAWLRGLAAARDRLEAVIWLNPARAAVLLTVLIAVAVVMSPSLHIAHGYRRVARVASLCLLFLTAVTSFTFFGSSQIDRSERAWIASLGEEVDEELAALQSTRHEILELAVLEDALRSVPPPRWRELTRMLDAYRPEKTKDGSKRRGVQKLAQIVTHELMWGYIADRLGHHFPIEPFADRTRQALARLETDASGAPLERLRDRRSSAEARFLDLDVLRVERSRGEAAKSESLAAVRELLRSVLIPKEGLADAVMRTWLDRLDLGVSTWIKGHVDRRRIRKAMDATAPPPPVWHSGIGSVLGVEGSHEPAALMPLLVSKARSAHEARVAELKAQRAAELEAEKARRMQEGLRFQQDWSGHSSFGGDGGSRHGASGHGHRSGRRGR